MQKFYGKNLKKQANKLGTDSTNKLKISSSDIVMLWHKM